MDFLVCDRSFSFICFMFFHLAHTHSSMSQPHSRTLTKQNHNSKFVLNFLFSDFQCGFNQVLVSFSVQLRCFFLLYLFGQLQCFLSLFVWNQNETNTQFIRFDYLICTLQASILYSLLAFFWLFDHYTIIIPAFTIHRLNIFYNIKIEMQPRILYINAHRIRLLDGNNLYYALSMIIVVIMFLLLFGFLSLHPFYLSNIRNFLLSALFFMNTQVLTAA